MKMNVGELKQQLAVANAEGAEYNEKAIQASAQLEGLHTQVCCNSSIATLMLKLLRSGP